MGVDRVDSKDFLRYGVAFVVSPCPRQLVGSKKVRAPIVWVELQGLTNRVSRLLAQVVEKREPWPITVYPRTSFWVQSNRLPAKMNRGIDPRFLTVKSSDPFHVGACQAAIGQGEFRI